MQTQTMSETLHVKITPTLKGQLWDRAHWLGVRPSELVRVVLAQALAEDMKTEPKQIQITRQEAAHG